MKIILNIFLKTEIKAIFVIWKIIQIIANTYIYYDAHLIMRLYMLGAAIARTKDFIVIAIGTIATLQYPNT